MICISCGKVSNLIESHVISKFFRNRITGIVQGNSKKFDFQWCEKKGHPKQDLPKPHLLCASCDSSFGGDIEGPASKILIPSGDPGDPETWQSLKLRKRVMPFNIANRPFAVGEHAIGNGIDDRVLRKFSVLTAWRALHAMRLDGDKDVVGFLESFEGRQANAATVRFLADEHPNADLLFPYRSELYFLGPASAVFISGADDEVPFAWTFINNRSQRGIAVLMGYWVVVWSLRHDDDSEGNFPELMRSTFVDWIFAIAGKLRIYTSSR